MRVIPNLVVNRSDRNVCAVNVVTVAVTNGSDLEPVIASKSIGGGLEWSLSNRLGDEARVRINGPRVVAQSHERLERLEAGDADDSQDNPKAPCPHSRSFIGGGRGLAMLGVWNSPLLLSIKIWFSAKV